MLERRTSIRIEGLDIRARMALVMRRAVVQSGTISFRLVVIVAACVVCLRVPFGAAQAPGERRDVRVTIESDGWRLIGDLLLPDADGPVPATLLLNQAAGTREAYGELARRLAARGIASLRLDLRGHGESTNLGRFTPGDFRHITPAWRDVVAALGDLRSRPAIDPRRLAGVGARDSGESMAEAARAEGYARAYVALSPGSFSERSIAGIDESGVPWLFVKSRDEPYLRRLDEALREGSRTAELVVVPGAAHGTDLLDANAGLLGRITDWLAVQLGAREPARVGIVTRASRGRPSARRPPAAHPARPRDAPASF